MRVGLPVVRAVAEVRQPQRAAEQARRDRAAHPDGRVSDAGETFSDLPRRPRLPDVHRTVAAGGERAGCLIGFATQASIDPPRFVALISEQEPAPSASRATRARSPCTWRPATTRSSSSCSAPQTGDDVDKFERCDWSEGPARPADPRRLSELVLRRGAGAPRLRRPCGVLLEPFAARRGHGRRAVPLPPGEAPGARAPRLSPRWVSVERELEACRSCRPVVADIEPVRSSSGAVNRPAPSAPPRPSWAGDLADDGAGELLGVGAHRDRALRRRARRSGDSVASRPARLGSFASTNTSSTTPNTTLLPFGMGERVEVAAALGLGERDVPAPAPLAMLRQRRRPPWRASS